MVSMTVLFWMFVILFAVIGAMRGWAKEILVSFSVVLGLFFLELLSAYVPAFAPDSSMSPTTRFWIETLVIGVLVFFGYKTPNLRMLAGERFARQRIADSLLGFFIGALNGYLIVGTLWYFMDAAGYPFQPFIVPPNPEDPMGQAAIALLNHMPPVYLVPPWIYFAVALAFIFVVVVLL